MAAPILWAPRISVVFLQENLHVHKIPRFLGGGVFWLGGGGSADFIFMVAGIFLTFLELTFFWGFVPGGTFPKALCHTLGKNIATQVREKLRSNGRRTAIETKPWSLLPIPQFQWETDFYTLQVLGGVVLFDNSAPAVYKIQGP